MPRPGRIYGRKPKLVKVESRGKVYFDYAETRTYICIEQIYKKDAKRK